VKTVLVTGGTGLLGREVIRRLVATGYGVRVLTRHAGASPPGAQPVTGDLRTGDGLDEAVTGVDSIVHAASDPRDPRPVDVDGTGALLAAARRGGSPHLVYISIVGVDRIPLAYYRAKSVAEQLVEESGLPWTVLRTTQFHEFTVDLLRRLTRLPFVPAPRGWRIQPIDVRQVAARLVDAVGDAPGGRLPDLGGPSVLTMAAAADGYLRATGGRRRVVAIPVPGRFSAAYRSGANLAPHRRAGGRTWDGFLAELTGQPSPQSGPGRGRR
jgi:uncharacterized protein YbjT (DUF2867 family)